VVSVVLVVTWKGGRRKKTKTRHTGRTCTAGPAEQQEEEPPLRREEDNNNDPPRLLEALSLMTLKNLLPRVSGATLLIEIPIDKIGALKGISSSALYIPKKLIPKARNVYSKYLRDCVEKKTALAELKLFLLPIVIFNNVSKAELKKSMATALAQLEKDDWSSFRIMDMVAKADRRHQSEPVLRAKIEKRVLALVAQGELAKANRLLTTERVVFRVLPEEVFRKLSAKYPQRKNRTTACSPIFARMT
jgi:hypothetical protein